MSRCCVNAPKNHPHKWDYFRRLERGRYEVLPPYRKQRKPEGRVGESRAEYVSRTPPASRDAVHVVLHRENGIYVAECLEVAVVSQGRTLDELVTNLREALALHLEGGDAAVLGLAQNPRLVITYETPLSVDGARP